MSWQVGMKTLHTYLTGHRINAKVSIPSCHDNLHTSQMRGCAVTKKLLRKLGMEMASKMVLLGHFRAKGTEMISASKGIDLESLDFFMSR